MRIIMVQYDDTVDISTLVKGSTVVVNGVDNGKIVAVVDSIDPPIPQHYHENGATGPAIPSSNA